MRQLLLAIFILFSPVLKAQVDTTQKIIQGRKNSPQQQQKPYVILISADGFRHDYAEKHGAVYLQALGEQYVKAKYLMPSYPSLTFPNHYTLVTGLYPSHHGLVDNQFYDRGMEEVYTMSKAEKVRSGKWYGGTPLWVLAEQQQMLSASFYWVGTEAPIQGVLPTYYYYYNEKIPISKRIETVVNWLQLPEEKRPHLISFYFPEVDHSGHSFGPDAAETGEAVRKVDTAIYHLTEAVKKTGLPVNFIFVADHGMTKVDTTHPLRVPFIDTSKAVVVSGSELVQIYVKEKTDIEPLYQQLKNSAKEYSVFLKNEIPSRLHYNKEDDVMNRIGDIVLIPDWPFVFLAPGKKPKVGAHGFDPFKVPDMQAVFYAWGPALKNNKSVGAVKNVDVFPVITELLGLKHPGKIDGTRKLARKILKK